MFLLMPIVFWPNDVNANADEIRLKCLHVIVYVRTTMNEVNAAAAFRRARRFVWLYPTILWCLHACMRPAAWGEDGEEARG